MAIIIPAGAFNASLAWTCTGLLEPMTCSIGVLPFTGSPTVEEVAEAVALSCTAAGSIGHNSNMQNSYKFTGCTATEIVDDEPVTAFFGVSVTGTLAGGSNPPQCASLVTKRTARGGRKGRGRWYLPVGIVLSESGVDQAGNINAGELAQLQGCVDAFLSELADADLIPVLFHSDGASANTITSMSVSSVIATQRRRLR